MHENSLWAYIDAQPERNPKAFAFANPGRLAKTSARSSDVRISH
jgi:hypothetical protein